MSRLLWDRPDDSKLTIAAFIDHACEVANDATRSAADHQLAQAVLNVTDPVYMVRLFDDMQEHTEYTNVEALQLSLDDACSRLETPPEPFFDVDVEAADQSQPSGLQATIEQFQLDGSSPHSGLQASIEQVQAADQE